MGSSSCKSCCCSCGARKDDYRNEFEKVCSCKANGANLTTKYLSKSTGLSVVHVEIEGPIVSSYICITTRAQDDDGLPHVLEHLVYFGSEDYPYPGVLDRLANKCLASGTNAWTDIDHTCYTLSTAGSDGFSQLLPVYLDHIFFPLLTEDAFKTEVHHVAENGTDAGVVYSEMQATENSGPSRATTELYKTIFPPESGYHWSVGGMLKNLRESCSIEKVRRFHEMFYHPQNACVIVCGMVDTRLIFRALHPILQKWSKLGSHLKQHEIPCTKPWLTKESVIADPTASAEKTVYFPSSDDGDGCIAVIGLLGPSIIEDELEEACKVLLLFKYLTNSSCSPLDLEFVEKGNESLASFLDFYAAEYSRTLFYFQFDGVEPENKPILVTRLRKAVKDEVNNFNMLRMTSIIESYIQAELSTLENDPFSWLSQAIIQDFLYGNQNYAKFVKRLNGVKILEDLLREPESAWTKCLEQWILSSNWITVFAEPSESYLKELSEQEEMLVLKAKEAIGKEGLITKMKELQSAIAHNSKPIPSSVLKKVKVPSLKSIGSHKITRIKNPSWISTSDFPSNLYIDDIASNFIYVCVIMDTSSLEYEFRDYLPLFTEVILNSPMVASSNSKKEGHIRYEQVVAERSRDLQVCQMNIGLDLVKSTTGESIVARCTGSYSHLLAFTLQMELGKADKGLDWIRKTLWTTIWDPKRMKVAINKMIGDIYLLRRQGSLVCQAIVHNLIYRKESHISKSSLVHQLNFLKSLEEDAQLRNSENDIRTAFDWILSTITDPINMSLHIAAKVSKLRDTLDHLPCSNLNILLRKSFPFELPHNDNTTKRIFTLPESNFLHPLCKLAENSTKNQLIYGLGSEDSSYLMMVVPGPDSFHDPEVPALLTTLQYFTQLEGPIYKRVRGCGYAYGYSLIPNFSEGLIYFNLSQCSNLPGAYAAAMNIMKEHLSKESGNDSPWTNELVVAAKSSLIFECLESERTPLAQASDSCLSYYRNVPGTYVRELISKIRKVTLKNVRMTAKRYLLPLFHDKGNNFATAVVCPHEQVRSMVLSLAQLGKHVEVITSLDDL